MLLNFVCTSGGGLPQTATYPGMAPQGYNPQGWGAPGYQQTWQPQGQQQDTGKGNITYVRLKYTINYFIIFKIINLMFQAQ